MSQNPTGAPILETERLILRGPEAKDCEGFVDYFTSERSRYTGGRLNRREAWRLFGTEIGHWALRGFGMWSVTERGADDCVGMVGCWMPEGWPETELGWILWPDAEGRGIGYEAAIAARSCAYCQFGWTTAVSYIAFDNARSVALAERLGAKRDETAAFPKEDQPCLVYRHPSPAALRLAKAAEETT